VSAAVLPNLLIVKTTQNTLLHQLTLLKIFKHTLFSKLTSARYCLSQTTDSKHRQNSPSPPPFPLTKHHVLKHLLYTDLPLNPDTPLSDFPLTLNTSPSLLPASLNNLHPGPQSHKHTHTLTTLDTSPSYNNPNHPHHILAHKHTR
jgi:hypothetical protein